MDSESISVGKAAVGNLLGGIGYFYGQSKIAASRIVNVSFFSSLFRYLQFLWKILPMPTLKLDINTIVMFYGFNYLFCKIRDERKSATLHPM